MSQNGHTYFKNLAAFASQPWSLFEKIIIIYTLIWSELAPWNPEAKLQYNKTT